MSRECPTCEHPSEAVIITRGDRRNEWWINVSHHGHESATHLSRGSEAKATDMAEKLLVSMRSYCNTVGPRWRRLDVDPSDDQLQCPDMRFEP